MVPREFSFSTSGFSAPKPSRGCATSCWWNAIITLATGAYWMSSNIDRLIACESQVSCSSAIRNAGNASNTVEYSSPWPRDHKLFCRVIVLIVWLVRICSLSRCPRVSVKVCRPRSKENFGACCRETVPLFFRLLAPRIWPRINEPYCCSSACNLGNASRTDRVSGAPA